MSILKTVFMAGRQDTTIKILLFSLWGERDAVFGSIRKPP